MRELILASEGLTRASRAVEPSVRKLAAGILLQAHRDSLIPAQATAEQRMWRKDALKWFFSEEDCAGSFRWVCSILKMEPGRVRRWLWPDAPREWSAMANILRLRPRKHLTRFLLRV